MGSETQWRNYNVYYYHLDLHVEPDSGFIYGSTTMGIVLQKEQRIVQLELDTTFTVDQVLVGRMPVAFYRDQKRIMVILDIVQETDISLTVFYQGKPRVAKNAPWEGGAVWARDERQRHWAGVAIQTDGPHLWWPCKDSWYDKPDSMRLTYHCPKPYKIIGNGSLISEYTTSKTYSSEWKITQPILPYNVSFYIGRYKQFQRAFKNEQLHFYALDYHRRMAKKHFAQCNTILQQYEDLFGPYPYHQDGFKVVEAPYWGMEHQTAVAYGNEFKNDVLNFDFILLHEIAHEWWGNHISAKDPAWMWIHEALATYSEALFFERVYNKEIAIKYLDHQRDRIENKHSMEGVPYCRYHDYPDADMYFRGTWMLHTLRHHLHNDSLWFSLLRNIHATGKPTQYSGPEFEKYFSEKCGQDLKAFFDYFVRSVEVPVIQWKSTDAGISMRWKKKAPFDIWWKNQKLKIADVYLPQLLSEADLQDLQKYYYLEIERE